MSHGKKTAEVDILPDVKAQAVTFDKMYRQLSTNGEAFEALVMELLDRN